MIAIVAIIIVVFLQFRYGWIARDQTVASALINMSPSIGIALVYTLWLLVKTPWLLDAERQTAIDSHAGQIASLKGEIAAFASELTRPKFKVKNPSIDAYDETDEDNRYRFSLDLENTGTRPARDMLWQVIVAEEGEDDHRMKDSSIGAEIPIHAPIQIQFGMNLRSNHPPLFIIIAVRYSDAIVKTHHYNQIFYMRWAGAQQGMLSEEVRHPTIEERTELEQRFTKELAPFQDAASQNVASIPSSYID